MRRDIATLILAVPFNPEDEWYTAAPNRYAAELQYSNLILMGGRRPPAYRVIIQLKVDQHDADARRSFSIH